MNLAISTFMTGIACWALNKVYRLINDKITIQKELVGIRGEAMDAKYASERCEKDIAVLCKDMTNLKKYTLQLSSDVKSALEQIVNLKKTIVNHEVKLEKYGKVIEVVNSAHKRKSKG